MKEDASRAVVNDNENGKRLGHCVFMHQGYPFSFYDSTNMYTTRQENDRYVYHNVAMTVVIPNGRTASTTTRECSFDQKWAPEVCESTGGSIIARVGRV